MVAEELSTRLEIPSSRSFWPKRWIKGLKSECPDKGTRRTFVGAIGGGKERTYDMLS